MERARGRERSSLRAPPRRDVRAISRINAPRVLHAPINHIYNTSYRNISPSARGASRRRDGRGEKGALGQREGRGEKGGAGWSGILKTDRSPWRASIM